MLVNFKNKQETCSGITPSTWFRNESIFNRISTQLVNKTLTKKLNKNCLHNPSTYYVTEIKEKELVATATNMQKYKIDFIS